MQRDMFDRGAKWVRGERRSRLVPGDTFELGQEGVKLCPVGVVFCELAVFAGDDVLWQESVPAVGGMSRDGGLTSSKSANLSRQFSQ